MLPLHNSWGRDLQPLFTGYIMHSHLPITLSRIHQQNKYRNRGNQKTQPNPFYRDTRGSPEAEREGEGEGEGESKGV